MILYWTGEPPSTCLHGLFWCAGRQFNACPRRAHASYLVYPSPCKLATNSRKADSQTLRGCNAAASVLALAFHVRALLRKRYSWTIRSSYLQLYLLLTILSTLASLVVVLLLADISPLFCEIQAHFSTSVDQLARLLLISLLINLALSLEHKKWMKVMLFFMLAIKFGTKHVIFFMPWSDL